MCLRNDLSMLTLPELEHTRNLLNLSDEELEIFNLLAKDKNIAEISMILSISTRTIDRKIEIIKKKMKGMKEWQKQENR